MSTITEVMTTIRACLNDHGITTAQAAEWCGITEHEMRHGLTTGQLSLNHCAVIKQHTGDMRAYGVTA